jgi:hypothetical protein
MTIIYSKSDVTPPSIKKCRSTLVKAWAEVTAEDKLYTNARREARDLAVGLRDKRREIARKMPCPSYGGCKVPCRRGRPEFSGMANNIDVAKRKMGEPCRVTYKTHWTYRISCICPHRVPE